MVGTLDVEHDDSADRHDHAGDREHQHRRPASQASLRAPGELGQDREEPEQSKRTKERDGDDQKIHDVRPHESPSFGGEVETDQVVDEEDEPDSDVGGIDRIQLVRGQMWESERRNQHEDEDERQDHQQPIGRPDPGVVRLAGTAVLLDERNRRFPPVIGSSDIGSTCVVLLDRRVCSPCRAGVARNGPCGWVSAWLCA